MRTPLFVCSVALFIAAAAKGHSIQVALLDGSRRDLTSIEFSTSGGSISKSGQQLLLEGRGRISSLDGHTIIQRVEISLELRLQAATTANEPVQEFTTPAGLAVLELTEPGRAGSRTFAVISVGGSSVLSLLVSSDFAPAEGEETLRTVISRIADAILPRPNEPRGPGGGGGECCIPSFDICRSGAQDSCGANNVAWVKYKCNQTTCEATCEFGCCPAPGCQPS